MGNSCRPWEMQDPSENCGEAVDSAATVVAELGRSDTKQVCGVVMRKVQQSRNMRLSARGRGQ